MGGIFGFFDYEKPGKGVDPNAPKKHDFFLFWEILWRKLSKFILINLIYFAALIPILTYVYMYFLSWAAHLLGLELTQISTLMFQLLLSFLSGLPSWVNLLLLGLSVIVFGPLTAGVTYVLRNFAREEHAWVSDIWDKFKENFKQGLFFGLLDMSMLIITAYFLPLFTTTGTGGSQSISVVGYLAVFVLVFYLFARNYFYVLMVTFNLTISQILRNSFIFAVVGLWRNILATGLSIGVILACMLINPFVEVISFILFAFSLSGFISVFVSYPIVKKFMIDPILNNQKDENTGGDSSESADDNA